MASPPGSVRLAEQEPEALATARFGPHLVSNDDMVFGDDDGGLFVAAQRAEQVLATAHQIGQTERDQARKIPAWLPDAVCWGRQEEIVKSVGWVTSPPSACNR
jgi:regulator of RNase E activity RraA